MGSVIVTVLNIHPAVVTSLGAMLLESVSAAEHCLFLCLCAVQVISKCVHVKFFDSGLPYWFSPFEVLVSPEAGPQKIRAWGPGLEGGVVGKSADFVVESVGTDVGVLGEFLFYLFILFYLRV